MNATEPVLLVERSDDYATLTLNRPEKRNALSVRLRDEISDALDELAGDQAIKAVVVTGRGPVFSAGFDLSEFERAAGDADFGRELWASSDRYHETVLHFPLPTVAAINGPALGGRLRSRGALRPAHRFVGRPIRAPRADVRRRRVRAAARSRRRRGRPRAHDGRARADARKKRTPRTS